MAKSGKHGSVQEKKNETHFLMSVPLLFLLAVATSVAAPPPVFRGRTILTLRWYYGTSATPSVNRRGTPTQSLCFARLPKSRAALWAATTPILLHSRYSLACMHAQDNKPDEALFALREVVDGLAPTSDNLEFDPELKSLRGDPRCVAIVNDAKKRAGASDKPQ